MSLLSEFCTSLKMWGSEIYTTAHFIWPYWNTTEIKNNNIKSEKPVPQQLPDLVSTYMYTMRRHNQNLHFFFYVQVPFILFCLHIGYCVFSKMMEVSVLWLTLSTFLIVDHKDRTDITLFQNKLDKQLFFLESWVHQTLGDTWNHFEWKLYLLCPSWELGSILYKIEAGE